MLTAMTDGEPLRLPRNLVAAAEQEGRTTWLATLPAVVARLAEAWSLRVDEPFQPGGQTAWVAPVSDHAGTELVLKLAWVHPETVSYVADFTPGTSVVRIRGRGCSPAAR
jgi:streptomycin 6-kinase